MVQNPYGLQEKQISTMARVIAMVRKTRILETSIQRKNTVWSTASALLYCYFQMRWLFYKEWQKRATNCNLWCTLGVEGITISLTVFIVVDQVNVLSKKNWKSDTRVRRSTCIPRCHDVKLEQPIVVMGRTKSCLH